MLNTFVPFLLLLNAIVPISAQSFAFEIGTEENQFEIRPPFFNLDLKKETGVSLILNDTPVAIQQSTFEAPCTFGGQGYFKLDYNPDDPNGLETIELSKLPGQPPYWFFDGVGDHCSKGMVFAINPSSEDQFKDFKSRAMNGAAPLSSSSSQAPTATSASGTSSPSASASASSVSTEQAQKTDESKPDDKNGTGAIYSSGSGILLASIVVAVTASWVVL